MSITARKYHENFYGEGGAFCIVEINDTESGIMRYEINGMQYDTLGENKQIVPVQFSTLSAAINHARHLSRRA